MNERWRIILKIASGIAMILILIVLFIIFRAISLLQSKEDLTDYKNATASVILSQDGKLIGKIFTENRTNITYNQLPQPLIHALIATEDARFYEHTGVDTRSLFRALIKTGIFRRKSSGGGSTITQQLAKNMFGRKNSGPFALLINKTKEAMLARRLEKIYTKPEILTLYFNTIPFGENVFGIEAASRRYFNKPVEKLKIEESAVLIGILKANSSYNPRLYPEKARGRRNLVLGQMQKYHYLKKQDVDSLKKLPLVINYSNIESNGPADYFLYQVKDEVKSILGNLAVDQKQKWNIEEDGLIITTTLNLSLQEAANKSFQKHLSRMQMKLNKQYAYGYGRRLLTYLTDSIINHQDLSGTAMEVRPRRIFDWGGSKTDTISVRDSIMHDLALLHAGLMAMDPVNGAVKAWVGGIDFKTQPYDQIYARRQMGSTFKPILYAVAMEEGIRPCFYLENDSLVISGKEDWSPGNYDHSHGGKYSLAGALIHSMNIPTVNLFLKIGFDGIKSLWQAMGFSQDLENNPSLALGTSEADIQELAVAYSTFSNGGYKIKPQKIVSIKSPDGEIIWENKFDTPKTRIISERTCRLINAILQKAVEEGTGSSLHSQYGVDLPVAGKTGTSHDYSDAWFVGYNPALVIVSRVGAMLPAVHFRDTYNGSGSRLALPLVAMTLDEARKIPALFNELNKPFPELSPDLQMELGCEDYKKENGFDNFIKIFKRGRISYDKATRRNERRKNPFFRRLFGSGE